MFGPASSIKSGVIGALMLATVASISVEAAAPAKEIKTNDAIAVDQFGYEIAAPKLAMLAEPVTGSDAGTFKPSGERFEIRSAADDSVAFSGSMTAWQAGKVDELSGNRVWVADFSSLHKSGEYYLLDVAANARSYSFAISDSAYRAALRAAVHTFYYQRCSTDISKKFGGLWTHAACHVGADQEKDARPAPLGESKTVATGQPLDVSGGWHDAGDMNKYVPFTSGTMWDLLTAYQWKPNAFPDDTNIPESGNGVPDLLDECKYELDWLLKMQRADGGVNNRVAEVGYDDGDNPGADKQRIYYTAETSWSTGTFAANCAHAALVFKSFDSKYKGYAATLQTAAERAWEYLSKHPSMDPASGNDGSKLAAAAGDATVDADCRARLFAGAELFALTGDLKYRDFFDKNYDDPRSNEKGVDPLKWAIDPSTAPEQTRAFFDYAKTKSATPSVSKKIRAAFKASGDELLLAQAKAGDDPYQSFMYPGHYCWGSNSTKCRWGILALMAEHLEVNSVNDAKYREIAEEYLHYVHGRNPESWCYLTNAKSLGASKSPMHPYHGWFAHPPYDAGQNIGAPPGYLVGGPNQFFSEAWVSPPHGEPPMKAFKDWDAGWNKELNRQEASWEVTEPAIYYEAAYVLLASQFDLPAKK